MTTVTLIRPPAVSTPRAYSVGLVPPLGLAYVAAALEASGHAVRVVDAVGEALYQRHAGAHAGLVGWGLRSSEIVARIPADAQSVGISVMFAQQWPEVDALIRDVHSARPDLPIFLGGEHAAGAWEFVLRTCEPVTACVLGEGEETAVELVHAMSAGLPLREIAGIAARVDGRPQRTKARARIRDVDELPPPAWHLFPLEQYLSAGVGHGVSRGRSLPILATRGCPYRCTFCSSPRMWTTDYCARDPAKIADEMAGYVARYRVDSFDFFDLTLAVRRDWLLRLCHEIGRRELRVTYQIPSGTRSEALDEEVLAALARTGCRNITYAPESGSRRTLRAVRKNLDAERVLDSMREAKRLGIFVKANLMVGFPNERRRDLLATVWFALRAAWAGVDDVPLYPVCPYPGTSLYDELVAGGDLPPLSNDFLAQLGYTDLTRTMSVARQIGHRELSVWRTLGMTSTYAVGYLRHPSRIVRSARNLWSGRSDSVVEQRLGEILHRARAGRRRMRNGGVDETVSTRSRVSHPPSDQTDGRPPRAAPSP